MNNKINAIIIDDEETYISSLSVMLKMEFPQINIIDKCFNVESAIKSIKKHKPELIFLDIILPDGTGFDLLEKLDNRNFDIIFTTSHSEFAVRAFEFSALHYLTKPIEIEKLKIAIDRFSKTQIKENFDERIKILKESFMDKPQKILLPSLEGLNVYNISDIIRCEADGNHTKVFIVNMKPINISKSLSNISKLLVDLDFARIHKSDLINLRYVKRFISKKSAKVVLINDDELIVSQNQREAFTEKLKSYAKSF